MRTRLAAAAAWVILHALPADAGALDPLQFQSLGSLSGAFTVDSTAVTLTSHGVTYQGFVYQGVAVFDFNSVTLGPGTGTGSMPVAILSRGDETISAGSRINFSGGNGSIVVTHPSHNPIITMFIPVPGTNGPGGMSGGMAGEPGTGRPATGGVFGGDLAVKLQGGSSGASGAQVGGPGNGGSSGGGGAGGGIELGAVGRITIAAGSSIEADGGAGSPGTFYGGASGGSGGGIFLHASAVDLGGSLSVNGGVGGGGGFGGGGGGSGGEILIQAGSGGFTDSGRLSAFGGASGPGGTAYGPAPGGVDGRIIAPGYVPPVPEPSTLAMAGTAAAIGIGLALRRRATS